MTSAARESGVPSHNSPTAADARLAPWSVETGWDSHRHPSKQHPISPSAQLNGRMDAVPPTRPAQGSDLTSRDRVTSGGQTSGPNIGESPAVAFIPSGTRATS